MLEPDASQIKRSLPPLVQKAVENRKIKPEDILIATDTDLQIAGEYSESWLVVTRERILVFLVDEEINEVLLLNDILISKVETSRTDTRVGSGFVELKVDGLFEELLRFSNKNADKFAKVTTILKIIAEGRQVQTDQISVEEHRGRCEKCGVRLPDRSMRICPKCMKRGLVFMRFMSRTRSYWPIMVFAMSLVILSIVISLVPAQLMAVLLDNVFGEKPVKPWFEAVTRLCGMESHKEAWLYMSVGFLAAATLAGSIVGVIREWLAAWVNNKLGFELRRDVFQKLQELAIPYHDLHSVGTLMTRCTQDVEALQGFINQLTSGFGYQLIQVFMVAAAMLTVDVKLTLCAILPAPVVMICTVWFYKRIVPRWRKYWVTRSNLSNLLHGTLNGIRVVKAFAQEDREAKAFASTSGKFRDAGLTVGLANSWFYPAMGWVFQLGSYFVWIIGGIAVLHTIGDQPGMTTGNLIMFLGYLGMFYAPLNSLTQMSTWFTQFTTQAHRVFEVLDEEAETSEDGDAIDIEIQGAIHFKGITFGYDPHIPVLHDVSFRVEPGEMIGIVGHSGSGKSTTVNLIMRFYDATEGEVQIDNVDIHKIRKPCLRRQIGFVAQDPFLFRGTVAENIAYGNPSVASQQILNASLAANAHMFITRIHDGYDTLLGERGSGLSGGERQRVAIARALLHNPRVLILDEATSSVDTIAEREIQKALEALSVGRTTIAIAHRLSTLRNCDRILVFEEGCIREQGTHEELLALNGIYKKLVDIQTQLSSDTDSVDNLIAKEELDKIEEIEQMAKAPVVDKRERRKGLEVPKIRYINPSELSVFSKDEGGMRVKYGEEVHEYVRAYRCFPISRPSEFIALWTGQSALEHKEIGMVRRLRELSPSSRLAVEHELAKRYFIHYIQKINEIKDEMGFLVWNVLTDKGQMDFLTRRFDRSSIKEVTTKCHIIVDVDNNRYEIEDLEALDAASRTKFLDSYW